MTAKNIALLGVAVPLDPTRVSLFATPPVVVTPQCPDGYCYVVNDARWDYVTQDHRAVLQKIDEVAASGRLEPAFGALAVGPGKLVAPAAPGIGLEEDAFAPVHALFGDTPPRTADGFALAVCDWETWLTLRRAVAEHVVRKLDEALGAGLFSKDLTEASRLQKIYEGVEGAPLDSVRIRRLILLKQENETDKYARRLFNTARLLKISVEELEQRVEMVKIFISTNRKNMLTGTNVDFS